MKMSDNISKLEEELKSVKQKLAEKEAEEEVCYVFPGTLSLLL